MPNPNGFYTGTSIDKKKNGGRNSYTNATVYQSLNLAWSWIALKCVVYLFMRDRIGGGLFSTSVVNLSWSSYHRLLAVLCLPGGSHGIYVATLPTSLYIAFMCTKDGHPRGFPNHLLLHSMLLHRQTVKGVSNDTDGVQPIPATI